MLDIYLLKKMFVPIIFLVFTHRGLNTASGQTQSDTLLSASRRESMTCGPYERKTEITIAWGIRGRLLCET